VCKGSTGVRGFNGFGQFFHGFFSGFQWFSKFSTVLVKAIMRSNTQDVVCEPNKWPTWLDVLPTCGWTHCSLCFIKNWSGLLVTMQSTLEYMDKVQCPH